MYLTRSQECLEQKSVKFRDSRLRFAISFATPSSGRHFAANNDRRLSVQYEITIVNDCFFTDTSLETRVESKGQAERQLIARRVTPAGRWSNANAEPSLSFCAFTSS